MSDTRLAFDPKLHYGLLVTGHDHPLVSDLRPLQAIVIPKSGVVDGVCFACGRRVFDRHGYYTTLQESDISVARMKSYLFSMGNSYTGPVGFTARVNATSKVNALAYLRGTFGDDPSVDLRRHFHRGPLGVQYLDVFFNPAVMSVRDIEEWGWEDIDP
ncbi:MAG: hypothetical protein JWM95_1359 [Gemmatimonadetes bacterium]|nr:hypothetical protein [Gemmatimonadota bacterium]